MTYPSLIIFDCDGTLVDSEAISNQLISDMMNEIGIPMTLNRSLQLFEGKSFKDISRYIQSNLDVNPEIDFESEFRKRSKIAFEKYLKPNPGVISFLNSLNIPYCLASNGPRIKMETTLSVTGLKSYFPDDRIFSAYDINIWKPEPDLFLLACRQMGFPPSEALVFEDTISGIQAAEKAGIRCIVYESNPEKHQFAQQGYQCIQSFENLILKDLM